MDLIINAMAEHWFWTVIGVIIVIWIAFATVESVLKTTARERTRREIAAYIAEGSMTPEQGERLLNAGRKSSC